MQCSGVEWLERGSAIPLDSQGVTRLVTPDRLLTRKRLILSLAFLCDERPGYPFRVVFIATKMGRMWRNAGRKRLCLRNFAAEQAVSCFSKVRFFSGSFREHLPMNVLAIDIGGTGVKLLLTGETERRRFDSGPEMTPEKMVAGVKEITADWNYDVVAIGYPGVVRNNQPLAEPHNLAPGWVGFDFQAAFGRPVKVINDAAMQALGSYQTGKMLFLGLGTGLGLASGGGRRAGADGTCPFEDRQGHV